MGQHTSTSFTANTPSSAAGVNAYCAFQRDTIQNTISGIGILGSTTLSWYGIDNDITNCYIRDFGGGTTITANGIISQYQLTQRVTNNRIANLDNNTTAGSLGATSTIYGIYLYNNLSTTTAGFMRANNNTVVMSNNSSSLLYGIALGGASAVSMFSDNNNITLTSWNIGSSYGIWVTGTGARSFANANNFRITQYSSGTIGGIWNGGVTGLLKFTNNNFNGSLFQSTAGASITSSVNFINNTSTLTIGDTITGNKFFDNRFYTSGLINLINNTSSTTSNIFIDRNEAYNNINFSSGTFITTMLHQQVEQKL